MMKYNFDLSRKSADKDERVYIVKDGIVTVNVRIFKDKAGKEYNRFKQSKARQMMYQLEEQGGCVSLPDYSFKLLDRKITEEYLNETFNELYEAIKASFGDAQ